MGGLKFPTSFGGTKDKACYSLCAHSKLNSTFLLKNIFSGQYRDIRNMLTYTVNWYLKLPWNDMTPFCLSRSYHFEFFKGCLPQISLGQFLNALSHLLKMSISWHWFVFTPWNTSENQGFPDVFSGQRKRSVPWNGLRAIESSVTYFVTYISNWR